MYRRFLLPSKDEKVYVNISRITTIILMVVSAIVTLYINRISGAWEFILECGAGVGSVLILRWFWWRINAWSEISAMITPFVTYPILKLFGIQFPDTLFFLVGITTVVWIIITFLTKPTDEKTLFDFYRKIHPGGVLWKKISILLPEVKSDSGFGKLFVNWLCGVVLVYSLLFGIGYLIFGNYTNVIIALVTGAISIFVIVRNLSNTSLES